MPRKPKRPSLPGDPLRPPLAVFDDDDQRRAMSQQYLASIFPSWPGESGVPDVIRLTDSEDGRSTLIQIDPRYYQLFPAIVDERMGWLAHLLRTSPRSYDEGSQVAFQAASPPTILFTARPDALLTVMPGSYPVQSLLCVAENLHERFIYDTRRVRRPDHRSGMVTPEGGRRWIEAYDRGEGDAALQLILNTEWLSRWPFERGSR